MRKITVYRDRAGEWRWRLQERNGRIVADSGEGYTRKAGAKRAAERMQVLVWPCNLAVEDGAHK